MTCPRATKLCRTVRICETRNCEVVHNPAQDHDSQHRVHSECARSPCDGHLERTCEQSILVRIWVDVGSQIRKVRDKPDHWKADTALQSCHGPSNSCGGYLRRRQQQSTMHTEPNVFCRTRRRIARRESRLPGSSARALIWMFTKNPVDLLQGW